jgi:hypothetical protein
MNRNLPNSTRCSKKSGLQVDRIVRIITEQWPEIWQASIDRQNRQIAHRKQLLLIAHQQLQKKAS